MSVCHAHLNVAGVRQVASVVLREFLWPPYGTEYDVWRTQYGTAR